MRYFHGSFEHIKDRIFYSDNFRMLEDVQDVGTTANCWSCHNKAYLGMTVHWIQKNDRSRQHAVLACKRLEGSHTFDVLAEAMSSIHSQFGLQEKVRRTTTDNGSNFVKAFDKLESKDIVPPNVDADVSEQDEELLADAEVFLAVEDILEGDEIMRMSPLNILPKHMRCAAHTMNLVAATDAEKALDDEKYQEASTSAMKKARLLWNAQSRSVFHADAIKEELKKRLIVPNVTRWNSTYDAVAALKELLEQSNTR